MSKAPKYENSKYCLKCQLVTSHGRTGASCSRCKMLRERYGITAWVRRQIEEAQEGRCKICKQPPGPRGLFVDYNKETRTVYGLLCQGCSSGLRAFNNALVLEAALEYMKERL